MRQVGLKGKKKVSKWQNNFTRSNVGDNWVKYMFQVALIGQFKFYVNDTQKK